MPYIRIEQLFCDTAGAIRDKTGGAAEVMRIEDMPYQISLIKAEPPASSGEYIVEVDANNNTTHLALFGTITPARCGSGKCTEVTLMEDVTALSSSFASSNTKLLRVNINGQLSALATGAFNGCTTLAEIKYKDGTTNKIPDGVTSIPKQCFYNCKSLNNITLHDNITEVLDEAFYVSSAAAHISSPELPANLVTIGAKSFYYQVYPFTKIPSSVSTIAANAFYGNSGLTTITFEGTPTSIASTAFNKCDMLTTINVPWAEGAVANAPWGATNATINYNYQG